MYTLTLLVKDLLINLLFVINPYGLFTAYQPFFCGLFKAFWIVKKE